MSKELVDQLGKKMDQSVQALQKELVKLRTGRASASLVDSLQVDYYGSNVPLSQVANITTPDARTVQIVPWEASMLPVIEKAIPQGNGQDREENGRRL
jgi:ribosome recycling factor